MLASWFRFVASVGSSLVNPSSADELIFGRNVDASGDDPRDFVDSAGEGAYMNRRNPYDVTNTYKRRPASGWLGRGADDSTVDELLYGGRDLGADRSMACTDASRPLSVTEEGTAAGTAACPPSFGKETLCCRCRQASLCCQGLQGDAA